MMAALDSTASVIWLVMSFLTMSEPLSDTVRHSRSIPARVMHVVMMPIRVASLRFTRNFMIHCLHIADSIS